MYYVFLVLHLLIALLLGVVVLLQRSKGGGLAGAFGGVGAGEAMFGSRGVTTMLHKTTIYLAIAFMFTSLGLVYMTAQRGGGASDVTARPSGRVVLPVGGDEVAAPDAPTSVPVTGDEVVPGEGTADDSIVPAAGSEEEETAQPPESGSSAGEGESGNGAEENTGGGGR